jgi:hypothetical protein
VVVIEELRVQVAQQVDQVVHVLRFDVVDSQVVLDVQVDQVNRLVLQGNKEQVDQVVHVVDFDQVADQGKVGVDQVAVFKNVVRLNLSKK